MDLKPGKDIDKLLESYEKEIDFAYKEAKAKAEPPQDKWLVIKQTDPGDLGNFVGGKSYSLLITDAQSVLDNLIVMLCTAKGEDVSKLQGSISVYKSLIALLKRIKKLSDNTI